MNHKINIDSDIPIPLMSRQKDWDFTTAIREMRKGQSFKIPLEKRASALTAFKRLKVRCISRQIGEGFCRIWRAQ